MHGGGRGRLLPGPRLFEPGEFVLRPTGLARIGVLARLPQRPATERERLADEDRQTMLRLRAWGAELARRFGLRCAALDPEQEGVTEHYGICYEDGVIRIRLRHARTGKLLKESSLVDTLCHELAHLRYLDHSPRFQRLYSKILEAARELGYYRPGPQLPPGPRQLSLFDPAGRGEEAAWRSCSRKRSATSPEG